MHCPLNYYFLRIYLVPPTIVSITPSEPFYFESSSVFKVKVPTGYTGAVLTCIGTAWPPPQDVIWINNTIHAQSGSKRIGMRFISTELRVEGFTAAKAGEYTCVVQGNLTSQTRAIKLEHTETALPTVEKRCTQNHKTTVHFLIRVWITPVPCIVWPRSQFLTAEARLMDAVVLYITSRYPDYDIQIMIDETSCSDLIYRAVVFRGRIVSVATEAKFVFCELQKWQQAGSLVFLTNRSMLLQVDRDCILIRRSSRSPECVDEKEIIDTSIAVFSSGTALFMAIVIFSAASGLFSSLIRKRYCRYWWNCIHTTC